ncbi:RHS repeat-associated core domain-containing protein [Chitinophaga sp. RAB17]|uniref:RHS repeat-associated core domain-containing protein n=1 Tax=Chitinophaga sp. RAB17 TaxID=3233049 RepID=UPI003F8E6990
MGVTGTNTQLEALDYEFNIRGWLKSVNKSFVNTAGSTQNWFGQDLSYDYGFTANQYNGNIAGAKWKSRGDGIARAYGYSYDKVNRLTVADFTQQNSGSINWTNDQKNFSVSGLAYDANGNIQFMTQKGMNGTTIQTIDSLKYGYQTSSNKLSFVTDRKNNTQGLLGDFKEINNNETIDYTYDANGNLTSDANKNIAGIRYNYLNLPDSIAITGKGLIKYQYGATGEKQRKIVTDNTVSPAKVTTTDYIDGFVYQNDTLQFLAHEEGRVRAIFQSGQPVAFKYDYFVKDHLGNVRLVLTEQTDFAMYAATMEAGAAPIETALFSNIDDSRTAKPVGYPADESAGSNASVAKLSAVNGAKKIGPSIVLRVMAGDTVQMSTKAFYKSGGPKDQNPGTSMAENMLADLVQAFNGNSDPDGMHGVAAGNQLTPFDANFYNNDYQHLKEKESDQYNPDKPKAYLNFVLFDDQFKLVDGNSGVKQVKAEPDVLQTLAQDKMVMEKSGFLYVYTSNESAQDVYFDNVLLAVNSGPLLEETHYYPFGLTMAGISSNALKGSNYAENRLKYNGKELQNKEFGDGSGLEWYDYGARMYDVQLGRWHSIDPLVDKWNSYSPYNYTLNSPVNYVDPDGQDVRIGIQRDINGNWTITLSSTIYVTGYGADERVGEYNQYLKDHPNLMTNTAKNEDGTTTTTTNLDFKYVLATDEDIARVENENTRNGDNLMKLENNEHQSASGGSSKEIYSKEKNPATGQWDKIGMEFFADFKVKMGNSKDGNGPYYGSPHTAFHEVMHLFGLKDWYKTAEAKKAVGPNDIMNRSVSPTPIIHQIHWNNWGKDLRARQQQQGNNFIFNHFVE